MLIRKGRTQPVKIQMERFETIEQAKETYATEVAAIKEIGGYEEFDISAIGATCYGTEIEIIFADKAKIRCTLGNIYDVVESQSDQSKNSAEQIAIETMQKILQKSSQ